MALSRFWLINGRNKKGKKSKVKIAKKKAVKKTVKKSAIKTTIKPFRKSVKKAVKTVRPMTTTGAIIPEIIEPVKIQKVYIQGENKMAKKARKIKRAKKVAKKVVRKSSRRSMKAQGKHRITTYRKGTALVISKKSKLAKRKAGMRVNPISVKGIIRDLKPMAMLGGASVASVVALNKGISMIPKVKEFTGIKRAGAKVALGLGVAMLTSKFIRNNTIRNGIILGSILSAISDYFNFQTGVLNAGTTAGIKVLSGSPLSFGTPKTILGNPKFTMNGIKVNGVNGVKLPVATNTVAGYQERY